MLCAVLCVEFHLILFFVSFFLVKRSWFVSYAAYWWRSHRLWMFLSRKCITVVSARIIHSRRRCYCIRSDNEQLLSHNELRMHTHSNFQSRRRSRFCVISFRAKTFHLSFAYRPSGGGGGGERKMIREMNGIFLFCVKIDSSSICEYFSLMALEPFEQINLLQFAQLESWVVLVNIYDPIAAINNLWIQFAFAELAVDYDNLAANASQRKVISTWLRIQRVPMAERISRRRTWHLNAERQRISTWKKRYERAEDGLWTMDNWLIEYWIWMRRRGFVYRRIISCQPETFDFSTKRRTMVSNEITFSNDFQWVTHFSLYSRVLWGQRKRAHEGK